MNSDKDIDRVKNDIDTIRQATGMGYSFGWADVYGQLIVAMLLLIVGPWMIIPRNYLIARVLNMVLLMAACVFFLAQRIRFRRSTGKSSLRRRDYTMVLVMLPVLLLLLRLYPRYIFPRFNLSIDAVMVAFGSLCFGLGLGISMTIAITRQHLTSLPVSITLALVGLFLPLCPLSRMLVYMAVTGGLSIVIMSGLEARLLRKAGIPHGTD